MFVFVTVRAVHTFTDDSKVNLQLIGTLHMTIVKSYHSNATVLGQK